MPDSEKPSGNFLRIEPGKYEIWKKRAGGIIAILFIAVMLYFFLGGKYGMINYIRYRHYENTLYEQLEHEKQRTDSLIVLIKQLKSDTLYIESIARTRLGMIKPGEKVIKFKNDSLKHLYEKPDTFAIDTLTHH